MTVEAVEGVSSSYVPGGWVAIAGRRTWLLADLAAGSPAINQLWALQRRDAGHLEVLDALAGGGLRSVPSFALAGVTDAGVIVLLRGGATAQVGEGPGARRLEAGGASTWIEHRCEPGVERVELIAGAASGEGELPLSAGVARASRLLLRFGAGSAPRPVVEQPLARERLEPAPETPVVATTISATQAYRPIDEEPGVEDRPEGGGAAGPPADAPASPPGYDHLFGLTVQRSVEDAAVRDQHEEVPRAAEAGRPAAPPPPSSHPPAPASPPLTGPVGSGTSAVVPPPVVPPPPPPGRGLIDRVPWREPGRQTTVPIAPGVPEAAASSGEGAAEADGMTISRDAQRELLRRARAEAPASRPGPTVHAIHCRNGHANPAPAVICRVCRAALPDQTPVTVPRPVLGVLRMSTGDMITLDRSVLMGRGPSSERLVGGERPHVVRVPSPNKDISRTHLEVRLDGWHVLVTDLRSTNGTFVTLPGREPERLRPDAPAQIEPGTVVSLAEEVSFQFEVAP